MIISSSASEYDTYVTMFLLETLYLGQRSAIREGFQSFVLGKAI